MSVDFDAEFGPMATVLGAIDGLAASIRSSVYVNEIIKETNQIWTFRFNEYMHAVSASRPENFHHVYEWNMVGLPGGQLWDIELQGRGRNRVRSFKFLPSKTTVPWPDIPPSSTGKTLQKEYVFAAKAWVMEYSIPVNITGDVLLMYLGDDGVEERTGQPAAFIFGDNARIENPGGEAAGNFTQQWNLWHSSQAPIIFDTEIRPKFENDINETMDTAATKARVSRGKVGLKDFKIRFDASQAAAKAELIARARKRSGL